MLSQTLLVEMTKIRNSQFVNSQLEDLLSAELLSYPAELPQTVCPIGFFELRLLLYETVLSPGGSPLWIPGVDVACGFYEWHVYRAVWIHEM